MTQKVCRPNGEIMSEKYENKIDSSKFDIKKTETLFILPRRYQCVNSL